MRIELWLICCSFLRKTYFTDMMHKYIHIYNINITFWCKDQGLLDTFYSLCFVWTSFHLHLLHYSGFSCNSTVQTSLYVNNKLWASSSSPFLTFQCSTGEWQCHQWCWHVCTTCPGSSPRVRDCSPPHVCLQLSFLTLQRKQWLT